MLLPLTETLPTDSHSQQGNMRKAKKGASRRRAKNKPTRSCIRPTDYMPLRGWRKTYVSILLPSAARKWEWRKLQQSQSSRPEAGRAVDLRRGVRVSPGTLAADQRKERMGDNMDSSTFFAASS